MAEERQPKRVFSIPAGAPFLPTLADAFLTGRLVSLPSYTDDPLALADATILLPTRRAVRAFREILVERLGSAILPAIRPIGDVDEEEHLLQSAAEPSIDRLTLPAAIPRLARRLILARLVLNWGKTVRREMLKLGPNEPLLIPASATDATRLAGDLARLMDDLATAGVSFEEIDRLVPDDQTGYFRITLDFLRIAAEQWPRILSILDRVDPATRRDFLIRAESERLACAPAKPVIAAGSTGSIPATAMLLATIAGRRNGAVVLPGLDTDLDEAGFAAIGGGRDENSAFGHPQFGLKRLLGEIGVRREEVEPLGEVSEPLRARAALLSEALRPAETTESWADYRQKTSISSLAKAVEGVGLIVARNEQEEALAIALALREAIEKQGTTAALVTPDRTLARRVSAELGRWGVVADDSAGKPLKSTVSGVFARLVTEAALNPCEPVALLALLKHPMAAFGLERAACRRAARALEIALFRGKRVSGGTFEALQLALAEGRESLSARYVARARRRLSGDDWDAAQDIVNRVGNALGRLPRLLSQQTSISSAVFAEALAEALQQAAIDENGDDSLLWRGPADESLARLLTELAAAESDLDFAPQEAPALLEALMDDISVTQPPGADPRIHIWGTLEARLQSVDLVILGGLDEGVWPAGTRTDPWLSRAMRAEIGLDPPERRIGQAAHDFAQAFMAPRVLVSRAEKRGGTPTVASRWLQRLTALLGEDLTQAMREGGEKYLRIARAIDSVPAKDVVPARRPAPCPPVAARPRRLSITEIETLIRDPYAIYAKHVLKLEPLDELGIAPDYALRGTLIHDALGRFAQGWTLPYDAAAEARLRQIGAEALAAIADFPDIRAIWSHRLGGIARWFIAWEAAREAAIARRFAEIDGELAIPVAGETFRLRGRADRIDLRVDGGVEILDFKTGAPPSARQVMAGLAPQLALEAGMVRAGAFGEEFAKRSVSTLAWLALGQAERGEPFRSAVEKDWTADELGEEALRRLTALIAAFQNKERAYVSRARPMFETRFESPYDHLARVREWALAEDAGEPP